MTSTLILKTLLATGFMMAAGQGMAQGVDMGSAQFAERCAICHGADGGGDGALGTMLAVPPKDLRLLASENDGEFPAGDVIDAIIGERLVVAHGSDMPVWGDYLMAEALEDRGINPKDARMIVDGRILSLVYYIHSVQTR